MEKMMKLRNSCFRLVPPLKKVLKILFLENNLMFFINVPLEQVIITFTCTMDPCDRVMLLKCIK